MADSAPNTPTAPLTDLGQELGILFAFSFFMISSLVAYWVGWKSTSLVCLSPRTQQFLRRRACRR